MHLDYLQDLSLHLSSGYQVLCNHNKKVQSDFLWKEWPRLNNAGAGYISPYKSLYVHNLIPRPLLLKGEKYYLATRQVVTGNNN